jgi:hypothetical protein
LGSVELTNRGPGVQGDVLRFAAQLSAIQADTGIALAQPLAQPRQGCVSVGRHDRRDKEVPALAVGHIDRAP